VAYFRADYADRSLGELMNRLALASNGVLLPSSLADRLRVGEGDLVRVNVNLYDEMLMPFEFEVVGRFDYFPTMYPDTAPVLVTNLDYMEVHTIGVLPHSIWMQLAPRADSEAIMGAVRRLDVRPGEANDLNETLAIESRRLERTGIFGLLTVCFVAGALLSVANLFVNSTLMLNERAVRHAVLRALGLKRRQILAVVILERLVTLLYGLAMGILCGVFCARLYVPYFALGDASGRPIPPFIPFVDWERTAWIVVVIAAALLLAQGAVLVRLIRARLFEALRMGNPP
jgi:putative ABC transport system permease protein